MQSAILASTPHNSQAWLFRIGDDSLDIYADRTRNIGSIDPFFREMTIGLGCAIENAMLAAAALGYNAELTLMPDPADETHAAHIALRAGTPMASPLYDAIPQRHTHRGAYADRAISVELIAGMDGLISNEQTRLFWFMEGDGRDHMRTLILDATKRLIEDEQQSIDSAQWYRHEWDDVQAKRDGITLDAQMLPPALLFFAKMAPDLGREQNDASWLQSAEDVHLKTAAGVGIIAIPDRMYNVGRLEAGRLWQRMHLWATTQGIAMQPLNQPTERADREIQQGIDPEFGERMAAALGTDEWHAVMPFRLGYPEGDARPAPRRGVDEVIV